MVIAGTVRAFSNIVAYEPFQIKAWYAAMYRVIALWGTAPNASKRFFLTKDRLIAKEGRGESPFV